MKYFIYLICIILYPTLSLSQPITKSGVFRSALSADELSNRAAQWMATNTDYSGSGGSLIAGSSHLTYNPTIFYGSQGTKGRIEYRVVISINKDGYKYDITNFIHHGNENNTVSLSFGQLTEDEHYPRHIKGQRKSWEDKVWNELKKTAKEHSETVAKSIESAMSN